MSRPNVLIIHVDQHRWDCLGAYGNEEIKTPHIDQLAKDGVLYNNAFCSFPVCTPSRYSLLSGLHVHQHQGWNNHCTLPTGIKTFPKEMREAGYRTAAVGKMHFTPTYLDVGFDTMFLAEQDGPGRFDDDYHRYLAEKGLCDENDIEDQRHEYRKHAAKDYWETSGALTSNLSEEHHSTTWIADRAMELIEEWDDGGHLLMAGFIKPHHPFDPPPPWDEMYDPDSLSLLPGWTEKPLSSDLEFSSGYFPHEELKESQLKRVMSYYYATISQIDYHVGKMVKLLKDKGLYDNTMIIYTSDHGDYMGFHHLLLKSSLMYDPVMRVPLCIKYPKGSIERKTEQVLTSNIDLAPTILKTVGLEVPRSMGGHDLREDVERDDYIGATFSKQSYMIRTETDKLLYHRNPDYCRYFDLITDPMELNDRFKEPERQSRIEELKGKLLEWMVFKAPSPTNLEPEAPTISAENVPNPHDGHEAKMADYFRNAMKNR